MVEIIPIPAFRDNYIWLLHDRGHAAVVDPGDATPVLSELRRRGLALDAILVTHHHHDHQDGVAELLAACPQCVAHAPRAGHYTFPHRPTAEGDRVELDRPGLVLRVMEIPGHTLDHVAYYAPPHLFCGDTLFGCGCGRVFQGDCRQLHRSLQRLAALPEHTLAYCAHEYTEANIRFALGVDPDNPALRARAAETARLRTQHFPTLPTSIALERATNPFLRCDRPAPLLRELLRQHQVPADDAERVFCFLRERKNAFQYPLTYPNPII